jgi:hypothetical protein
MGHLLIPGLDVGPRKLTPAAHPRVVTDGRMILWVEGPPLPWPQSAAPVAAGEANAPGAGAGYPRGGSCINVAAQQRKDAPVT